MGLYAGLLVISSRTGLNLFRLIAQRRTQEKQTLVEFNDHFYTPSASAPIAEQWKSPV